MKKILVIGSVLALIIGGCKSKDIEDKTGAPIVSPTKISTDKQGSGAPQFPAWYTPWWKNEGK